MNNNRRFSGIGLLIVAGIAVLACLLLKNIIPALPGIMLFIAIVALIGLVILVIVVVALGLKSAKDSGPAEKTAAEKTDDEKIMVLHKGRTNLVQLRSMTQRVSNTEVRSLSNSVCDSVDKILVTLKEKTNKIASVRQFFNYYIPTLGEIISKYNRIEKSGVPAANVTEKVKKYLTDINNAMKKQYNGLFDDDILDMSVEMEAMTMAVKRDGLLTDEDMQVKDGEKTISLTV